jgi:hypothetical protein
MLVTVWKSCLQYKKMLGSDVLVQHTEPEGALPVPVQDSSHARRFLPFFGNIN